jgi:hypothetical protein
MLKVMKDKIKAVIMRTQDAALCLVKKWWRPMTYIVLGTGTLVNTIIIPLHKMEGINLAEFAALIASWSPIIAIREWGKVKGVETDSQS